MNSSNFSRSFLFEFPGTNLTWYSTLLSFNAGQEIITIPQQYSDYTQQNFRSIIFTEALNIPDQIYTVVGYTELDGLTTKEYELGVGETTLITEDLFWYVRSIKPSLATTGMTVGSGFGKSAWMMHDGSTFKNMVTVDGQCTWTIKGSDKKFSVRYQLPSTGAPEPFAIDADPYNIVAGLTNQTATLAFPVNVDMPIEAIQIVVDEIEGQELTLLKWRVATKNLL